MSKVKLSPTHLSALRDAASEHGFDQDAGGPTTKRAASALWKKGYLRWGFVRVGPRDHHRLLATDLGRAALSDNRSQTKGE